MKPGKEKFRSLHITQAPTRLKILIVEDQALLSWSLDNILSKSGFGITVVNSGEKAVEELTSSRYDLIITDLELPGINGQEVASAVKSRHPGVPVIMISTAGRCRVEHLKSLSLIDHFFEKPFDLNEIVLIIHRLLNNPQASAVKYPR